MPSNKTAEFFKRFLFIRGETPTGPPPITEQRATTTGSQARPSHPPRVRSTESSIVEEREIPTIPIEEVGQSCRAAADDWVPKIEREPGPKSYPIDNSSIGVSEDGTKWRPEGQGGSTSIRPNYSCQPYYQVRDALRAEKTGELGLRPMAGSPPTFGGRVCPEGPTYPSGRGSSPAFGWQAFVISNTVFKKKSVENLKKLS